MRRSDREITDIRSILGILDRCDICRIALCDNNVPYVIALNYGVEVNSGAVSVYFHCAREGRKLDIIGRNNHACLEADRMLGLVDAEKACGFTAKYESVMAFGRIFIVGDNSEKAHGLGVLMKKYAPSREFSFFGSELNSVTVLRMDVESITGKSNI